MRGDLIIQNDTIVDLPKFGNAIIDGNRIAGINAGGVKQRDSQKTTRIAINGAAIKAVGGAGPIRFVMTLDRADDGGRIYTMIPAGDRPAHGVIRARK